MNPELSVKRKNVPVSIIGLEYSGKTTFLNWLIKQRFTRPKPTVGYNFEVLEVANMHINIFDLSGHEKFRENIWKNFVQSSVGIVFFVDSSDKNKLKKSAKWFWKVVNEWLQEIYSEYALLFIANKADLKNSLDLETIIRTFDLYKMSKYSNISFQIFKTSIKEELNIKTAFQWLVNKLNSITKNQQVDIHALIISDKFSNTLYSYDPHNISSDHELLSGFVNAISSFSNELLGYENLKLVRLGKYYVLISQEQSYSVAIFSLSETNLPEARRIIYNIHRKIKESQKKILSTEDYQAIVEQFIF
ncbi:MAG: 50S ribosome-binding GTPase [Candidatus Heimdallarchaeum endolithica]|uniref:50S ribosome-binding GTPase n=1 Tax=Candidatus Heimdallarchaeum endolithica TaxID=2876572 RepID=A0A9Y1BT91_9ARCH|nr:MAG: 50S ribosome-binding GTPase [Candidatus Heimdallarchaeum endolithica]